MGVRWNYTAIAWAVFPTVLGFELAVSMQVDQTAVRSAAGAPEEEPPAPPPTAARANPTDIPARKPPLLLPTHPCSAPSDFAFARHSPMQAFSPYTRHLACHALHPPTLAEAAWRQPSASGSTPGNRNPLHRASASSRSSCSSPMTDCSPGSQPAQDAAACRALVKHTSGRAAPRQVVVQLDSSLEARRLYTSPDGVLRASSGRSDVVSSRWGSPGAGGTEWASFQRQKLIEHPDSSQVRSRARVQARRCNMHLLKEFRGAGLAECPCVHVVSDSTPTKSKGPRYLEECFCVDSA